MKHHYDEQTMQAAIDSACEALGKGNLRPSAALLETVPRCIDWEKEASARLHLLKTALENLPEPPPPVVDGKPQLSNLRPISEAGEVPAGCVRVRGYKEQQGEWHLATWVNSEDTHFADIRVPKEAPKEEEKPDPYAELKAAHAAGKVIQHLQDGIWWNFTDPRGPAYSDAPDQYRIKPAPETFEAHGKVWTRHTPGDPMPKAINIEAIDRSGCMYATKLDIEHEIFWTDAEYSNPFIGWRYADEPTPEEPLNGKAWTPAVGDVVKLKSSGPKMSVCAITGTVCKCQWFRGDEADVENFEIATLIPAQP